MHVSDFLKSIYLWLCWVFFAVYGLSLAAVSRDYSLVAVLGFLPAGLLLLWSAGSREGGLHSCSLWA